MGDHYKCVDCHSTFSSLAELKTHADIKATRRGAHKKDNFEYNNNGEAIGVGRQGCSGCYTVVGAASKQAGTSAMEEDPPLEDMQDFNAAHAAGAYSTWY